jgi:GNAT superfamily N-acetyltransferase
MRHHDIRPIQADLTLPLRQQILRPRQSLETLIYPGDDHPLSLHLGAFHHDQLVGIASVSPELCPPMPRDSAWRLRGMAILPSVQRQGYGAALLQTAIHHIQSHHGTLLWCHGRTSALSFYRALGFVPYGDEFLVPVTGPHYLCYRILS